MVDGGMEFVRVVVMTNCKLNIPRNLITTTTCAYKSSIIKNRL